MEINQYSVVLVNLDPTVGSEINKTRPCVVLSPDEMNRHLNTIVVAPLTSTLKNYPTRVKTFINGKEGMIALDQIRTIDKIRVIKALDQLSPSEVKSVKGVIKETFVD